MREVKLLAEWFWTDRWMGSSAFLLPIEPRGLYREMLTQAWRRGARLPLDHEAIRRAVGCTAQEWKRCWPAIQHYWRVDGDAYVNDTQVEVWNDANEAREKASARGRKGAQARAHALAQAKQEQPHKPEPPSPSPSPSPISDQPSAAPPERRERAPFARTHAPGLIARPAQHGDCLAHGPVCFRPRMAEKYLPRFGSDRAAMVAWAEKVCAEWTDRTERGERVPEGDDFAFWAKRYDESFAASGQSGLSVKGNQTANAAAKWLSGGAA